MITLVYDSWHCWPNSNAFQITFLTVISLVKVGLTRTDNAQIGHQLKNF